MTNYLPLRGRIIIRPTGDSGGVHEQARKSGIIVPDSYAFDPRAQGRNQNSLMRGVVVAMGAPALSKDGTREVVPGFQPGDQVLYIGGHVSRLVQWNGEECRACAQEEVCGVVEEDDAVWYIAAGQDVKPFAPLNAETAADASEHPDPATADTEPPEFGAEGLSE